VETIFIKEVQYKGQHRIKLIFEYNGELIKKVRKLKDCKWSQTMRCWHLPYCDGSFSFLSSIFGPAVRIIDLNDGCIDNSKHNQGKIVRLNINEQEGIIFISMPYYLKEWILWIRRLSGAWWHPGARIWSVFNTKNNLSSLQSYFAAESCNLEIKKSNYTVRQRQEFKNPAPRNNIPEEYIVQLKLENKSERTIEVYIGFVSQFLNDFKGVDIRNLPSTKIRDYIMEHRQKRSYSESYQNQMVSAIKSFYRNVYNRHFDDGVLPRPKKSYYLPKILPKEYIQRMMDVCRNEKHKIIILMLYGFGLRVGELINVKVYDFDFDRRHLIVIKGKGRRDRVLPVPNILIPLIKKYIKSYLPGEYFIAGQNGEKYSASSIQNVVKKLARKANIKIRVTPHMLRHCYGTHMLERGTDLRYIQRLMGHKSSKTTEIYTHVSMQKLSELTNPLDYINF
jgi:integrase/recombinase XerD